MKATRWAWSAEKSDGAVADGTFIAESAEDVAAELRARSLTPIRIAPARRGLAVASVGGSGLSEPALARLSRRLAGLLAAGLPLAAALRISGAQTANAAERQYVGHLSGRIRAGASMTEAVADGAKTPRLFGALVAAGESLGDLGGQLGRLADHYEARVALRRELVSQLIYPAALVVMIVATFFFLSFLVLPQFEEVFATAGATAPPETRFVLEAGAFLRASWWTIPVVAVASVFALRALAMRHATRLARLALSVPVIGRHLVEADAAQFFRTLSALLQGGMALSRAVPIAIETVVNAHLKALLSTMEARVRGGERFARAIAALGVFPGDLVSFVEIGDETGALGAMTAEAATQAETQIRERMRRAMALLAPALTALMGLVTAGVIAAVMSGVLSLNDAVAQ